MKSLVLGWALGFALVASPAAAQTFPKLAGNPVVDQADIIPATEEAALNAQLLELQQKTGHQLVVATVNDLEGNDIADYGYRLGREWQIGDKEKDDGVQYDATALLTSGKPIGYTGRSGGGSGNSLLEKVRFPASMREILSFQMRSRKLKTVEFKNVVIPPLP